MLVIKNITVIIAVVMILGLAVIAGAESVDRDWIIQVTASSDAQGLNNSAGVAMFGLTQDSSLTSIGSYGSYDPPTDPQPFEVDCTNYADSYTGEYGRVNFALLNEDPSTEKIVWDFTVNGPVDSGYYLSLCNPGYDDYWDIDSDPGFTLALYMDGSKLYDFNFNKNGSLDALDENYNPIGITSNWLGFQNYYTGTKSFELVASPEKNSVVPEPATLLGFGLPMLMFGLGKLRELRKS